MKRPSGIRKITDTTPSTATTKKKSAPNTVAISLPRLNRTPSPSLPITAAIAAPTANGAKYMTYFVYWNITSASDSANSTIGFALSPITVHAAPKIRQKITTCRTSPSAIAPITDCGTACSRKLANVGCLPAFTASAASG